MLLRFTDIAAATEFPFGRTRLRAKVVTKEGLLPLDAPLCRQLEALFGAAVRLHFDLGHVSGAV